jgi:hypothetical protein
MIATGGPMGCGSRPWARAKPLAARYITHSKFNRAILLPAYIGVSDREGSGLWDPVVATNIPASFYALDEFVTPDHDAIEASLSSGRHPLLRVVHYFGFVQAELQRLKQACRRHSVTLVEDCAHVPFGVFGERGPGSYGDAAFYSLHKSIPVPGSCG